MVREIIEYESIFIYSIDYLCSSLQTMQEGDKKVKQEFMGMIRASTNYALHFSAESPA